VSTSYREAGVDTAAGDLAVELMKSAVQKTHGPEVLGGVGGFAGLFDVSFLKAYRRPLLATSTDGVGTKVAIAQALDKHDTIGQDLVGMVVDDIVVVGARPLFMTDYIACGKVVPARIADIVAGIARACAETRTALVGAVEADAQLGPQLVTDGDVVVAIGSSGLHSNGFSLVRHILGNNGIGYTDTSTELGGVVGEVLLEPTRLYTAPLLRLLSDPQAGSAVHALSHITGGGIAANLARVLPVGSWAQLDRASWSPAPVFRVLAQLGGMKLTETEGTWNLGIGMIAVVAAGSEDAVIEKLASNGLPAWLVGTVSTAPLPSTATGTDAFEQGAKGVNGGAVRLIGSYPR
jgi:phosphoribosylformylglycinamidine cyclo-ligase